MDGGRILSHWDSARPPEPCTAVLLDTSGALYMGLDQPLATLARGAVYLASCPGGFLDRRGDAGGIGAGGPRVPGEYAKVDDSQAGAAPGFSDLRDPFYASTFPVFYALAATTVTAYMLVIMLFITPRTFINGGIVYLGRRNRFTNSSSGGVAVGGRPWLQKVAALTVAISLSVATGATFRVAANQYKWGIQNAFQLQTEVMDSTSLKIIRLISDTFLWLAQAQTLIRLFQREREKVIIKWAAFALITLDVIFSALNSFQYANNGNNGNMRPTTFVEAVPALSYLFQLSLGLLYAAWVMYYSVLKKRYAFYHPLMKNMPLVAAISLFSILIPIVFFILDISKPELTGWGDYVRWVGAAAASVVVWEWVERIEALEREERKDGILGRQVFDGDDMMEVTAASSDASWSRFRKDESEGSIIYGGLFSASSGRNSMPSSRYRSGWSQGGGGGGGGGSGDRGSDRGSDRGNNPEPPRPAAWAAHTSTPVSRTDTASGDSTVYAVRYQSQFESSTPNPDPDPNLDQTPSQPTGPGRSASLSRDNSLELAPNGAPTTAEDSEAERSPTVTPPAAAETNADPQYPSWQQPHSADTEANSGDDPPRDGRWGLNRIAPLFRREPQPPPAAVLPHHHHRDSGVGGPTSQQRSSSSSSSSSPSPGPRRDDLGKWDVRARLEEFAASRADKLRERMRPPSDAEALRVTVIPAPQRGDAALQQLLEEEGVGDPAPGATAARSGGPGGGSQGGRSSGGPAPARDPGYVAPPMWPGVHPTYAESSAGSFESEDDDEDERGGPPASTIR